MKYRSNQKLLNDTFSNQIKLFQTIFQDIIPSKYFSTNAAIQLTAQAVLPSLQATAVRAVFYLELT